MKSLLASQISDQTRQNQWLGIGFKADYIEPLLSAAAPLGWLEIHAENYMLDGGPQMAILDEIAAKYPISCHGVGLSIGGESALDKAHLARLRALQDRLNPALFSEHLAWSSHGGHYFNDLLPLPYTQQTLQRVIEHVDQMQQALGRQILLENPSSYLCFEESTLSETDFLAAVSEASGCGLLLDVNNVFVSATNIGFSAQRYLADFPLSKVGEIHLAGHRQDTDENGELLLIDSHNAPVVDEVWQLYAEVIERLGPLPTLIEWDNDLPKWDVIYAEVRSASGVIERAVSEVA
ncbi:MAG: DUF692 domain-containing protein [Granulosicoccaceae bacterium]